ncbi:MAG: hypothetical protein HZY74_13455 [Brevundimonas sp.]|nr:MAG: hypothetical protein HZY74_13455 [Brevundimonas sp.]
MFRPEMEEDGDAADPLVLERMATLASGRAMTGRLWAEAKALAGLAESYARLVDRQRARIWEDTPPEDPTEPGRLAALAFLRAEGCWNRTSSNPCSLRQICARMAFGKGPRHDQQDHLLDKLRHRRTRGCAQGQCDQG